MLAAAVVVASSIVGAVGGTRPATAASACNPTTVAATAGLAATDLVEVASDHFDNAISVSHDFPDNASRNGWAVIGGRLVGMTSAASIDFVVPVAPGAQLAAAIICFDRTAAGSTGGIAGGPNPPGTWNMVGGSLPADLPSDAGAIYRYFGGAVTGNSMSVRLTTGTQTPALNGPFGPLSIDDLTIYLVKSADIRATLSVNKPDAGLFPTDPSAFEVRLRCERPPDSFETSVTMRDGDDTLLLPAIPYGWVCETSVDNAPGFDAKFRPLIAVVDQNVTPGAGSNGQIVNAIRELRKRGTIRAHKTSVGTPVAGSSNRATFDVRCWSTAAKTGSPLTGTLTVADWTADPDSAPLSVPTPSWCSVSEHPVSGWIGANTPGEFTVAESDRAVWNVVNTAVVTADATPTIPPTVIPPTTPPTVTAPPVPTTPPSTTAPTPTTTTVISSLDPTVAATIPVASPPPAAAVAGTSLTAPPLAYTGRGSLRLALLALALVGAGIAVLSLRHRSGRTSRAQ